MKIPPLSFLKNIDFCWSSFNKQMFRLFGSSLNSPLPLKNKQKQNSSFMKNNNYKTVKKKNNMLKQTIILFVPI